MQFKIFSVLVIGGESELEEINKFLRGKEILSLTQQSKRRFFAKASRLIFAETTRDVETSDAARRLRSLIAFTEHADTKALRAELLRRCQNNDQ